MYKHCAVAKCQKDAIVKHIYILLIGQYLQLIDVSCKTYSLHQIMNPNAFNNYIINSLIGRINISTNVNTKFSIHTFLISNIYCSICFHINMFYVILIYLNIMYVKSNFQKHVYNLRYEKHL